MGELIFMKYLKQNYKTFLGSFFCLFGAFSLFLNQSFTSDHVKRLGSGANIHFTSLQDLLAGGRVINYFIERFLWLLWYANIGKLKNEYVLQIVFMIILSFVAVITYNLFSKVMKIEKFDFPLLVMILLAFINPFFVESFVYVGFELGVGILLAVLATVLFTKKKYVFSTILLFLAISVYQSYLAIFLLYTLGYIYLKYERKLCKKAVVEFVQMFLLTGIAAFINILSVKLAVWFHLVDAEVKAVGLGSNLHDKIYSFCIAYYSSVVKEYGVLPNGFLIISIVILLIVYMIGNRGKEVSVWDNVYLLTIIALINICVYSIGVLMTVVWMPQRVTWPLYIGVSLVFIFIYSALKDAELVKLFYLLFGLFLLFIVYATQTCILDFYISNTMDKDCVRMVESEIEEYESTTGIEIKNIAAQKIDSADYFYADYSHFPYYYSTYSHKALFDMWSDVELLNYICEKGYKEIDMNQEIFDSHFSGKDWSVFNASEQLYFEGDTLYWAIY